MLPSKCQHHPALPRNMSVVRADNAMCIIIYICNDRHGQFLCEHSYSQCTMWKGAYSKGIELLFIAPEFDFWHYPLLVSFLCWPSLFDHPSKYLVYQKNMNPPCSIIMKYVKTIIFLLTPICHINTETIFPLVNKCQTELVNCVVHHTSMFWSPFRMETQHWPCQLIMLRLLCCS